jgi:hypothetical protein
MMRKFFIDLMMGVTGATGAAFLGYGVSCWWRDRGASPHARLPRPVRMCARHGAPEQDESDLEQARRLR